MKKFDLGIFCQCSFFNFLSLFIFMAALGLCCYTRSFSSFGEQRLLSCCGVQASYCGGFSCCGTWALGTQASGVVAHGLQSVGSVVVAHELCFSAACAIFPDQGLNPCLLHWQIDSYPLYHQGSPCQCSCSFNGGKNFWWFLLCLSGIIYVL